IEGWETRPLQLYKGLTKHEATALFMLRTEVLGTRDWLDRIGDPGQDPTCECGARRHTLNHLYGFCPLQNGPRIRLVDEVGPARPVSYTHLRAHETRHDLVCRLLLEK